MAATQSAEKAANGSQNATTVAVEEGQNMTTVLTNTSAMDALQNLRASNTNLTRSVDELATDRRIFEAREEISLTSVPQTIETGIMGIKGVHDCFDPGMVKFPAFVSIRPIMIERDMIARELEARTRDFDAQREKVLSEIEAVRERIEEFDFRSEFSMEDVSTELLSESNYEVVAVSDAEEAEAVYTDLVDASELIDLSDFTGSTTAFETLAAPDTLIHVTAELVEVSEYEATPILSENYTYASIRDIDFSETMTEYSAEQIQPQLGTQALYIANQQPENLYSLFA